MASVALNREERVGLAVAVVAHAALVALLVIRPAASPVIPAPERMTVTLSDEVGLTSTSPQPQAQAAPDEAPTLGEPAPPAPAEAPAEPQPTPKPQPAPEPARKVDVKPLPPRPVATPKPAPAPRPVAKPTPAPRPTASPAPRPSASPRPAQRPAATAPSAAKTPQKTATAPASTTGAPRSTATAAPRNAGGSRIGADFLKGVQGGQTKTGTATAPPAASIGPAVRSALSGAISRQLKPRWVAPQGVDADQLITVLTWNLNRDGSLSGTPRVVRQEGITDTNRPQAARHAEQAIRAVQLAAPFNLPEEYYDAWKRVAEFRFDKRLSQ